jgi:LPXTG-motif cell wall-anchored protein
MHGGGLHGDVLWLLIGLVLVVVVIWALRRRRRRWF